MDLWYEASQDSRGEHNTMFVTVTLNRIICFQPEDSGADGDEFYVAHRIYDRRNPRRGNLSSTRKWQMKAGDDVSPNLVLINRTSFTPGSLTSTHDCMVRRWTRRSASSRCRYPISSVRPLRCT